MRRLGPVSGYVLAVVLMALAAYWFMFSEFQPYDDEGYLNLTLRHFLRGDELYDEIGTQYGPFYYLFFGAVFELTGATVSTDSGRIVQVTIWVLSALLCGLAAHRATGRALLGVATAAVTFWAIRSFTLEPMHPGALLTLLVAAAGFAVAAIVPRAPRVGLTVLGVLGAAALLVKINVGGFVLIAAAFAVATTLPGWPSRRLPRLGLTALFVGLAPLLLLPDLDNARIQNLAVVVSAGAGAIVLVGSAGVPVPGADRWWRFLVAGAGGCVAVVLLLALALGTGLTDLVEAVLVQPTRQRSVLFRPVPIADAALLWSMAALAVAAAVRSGALRTGGPASGALRIAAGLGMWFVVTKTGPVSLGPETSPLGIVPLLAWAAAVPVAAERATPAERFVRAGLPALAVLQTLHVYPVSGSQAHFATVLFPLVGAICIADGLRELQAWGASAGRVRIGPRHTTVALGALAAWAVFVLLVRNDQWAHQRYERSVPLSFEGATRLRVPPDQARDLEDRVSALKGAGCRTVVSHPTLGSLTLWAGADAPVGLEPDSWSVQLDAGRQREVLDRFKGRPGLCGLRNRQLIAAWHQGREVPMRPIVAELAGWRVVDEVGGYELLLPPEER